MLSLAEIALPFAERGEAETQALADGLYRQLAGGADFAALAGEYSRSPTGAERRAARAGAGEPAAAGASAPRCCCCARAR